MNTKSTAINETVQYLFSLRDAIQQESARELEKANPDVDKLQMLSNDLIAVFRRLHIVNGLIPGDPYCSFSDDDWR